MPAGTVASGTFSNRKIILAVCRIQNQLVIVDLGVAVLAILKDTVEADTASKFSKDWFKECFQFCIPRRIHKLVSLVSNRRCAPWYGTSLWGRVLEHGGVFDERHWHANHMPDESSFYVMDQGGKVGVGCRPIFVPTLGQHKCVGNV